MLDQSAHSDTDTPRDTNGELVSVVISCYNKADFLCEAIESVLRQTYAHREIIIIDDGSTDESGTIATRYPIVRYLRQINQGPSAARNAGLQVSRGHYIVFLDADDRLLSTALEVGVRTLKAHPECAFVSGHVHLIAKDGRYVRTPEASCIEKDQYQTLLQYNYIWTPAAVMFRQSIFSSVAGYSSARCGAEDWDLYLRITRNFPVYCHEEIVAEYRVYDNQLTGNPIQMLKDSLACLHQQWPYIKGNRQFEEAYRKGIQETQTYYGEPLVKALRKHIKAHQWKQAIADLLALLRYDPHRFAQRIVGTFGYDSIR